MASQSLPSLLKNPDHYLKVFNTYCSASGKFNVYQAWVDSEHFSEAVVGKLQATLDGQEGLRVLGVGSGSGEIDCAILEQLLRQFPRIDNRVVDPSDELLGRYKALAESRAHQLHGVTCDWRQQTIEQYEKAGDLTKFHFIGAIHSMYHADSEDALNSWLTYLYSRLENGGVMLIIMRTEDCGCTRFLNGCQLSFRDDFNDVTSGDVRSSLDRLGIAYTQYRQPQRMNIATCFDRASEVGNLLLDFLTFTVCFREAAPEDLQTRVMEHLASSDCSERNGDEIWLSLDWDAVVINKPLGIAAQ
ncbi:histamine N-methyltransferase-like [Patiria miniata]|uniref:Histamine N-methyltransferase n=1 Tax=Patiria miniata TaxID=46514 RepID=A0A914A7Q5_PATMI|nr:histamine N-methyltransferase-like [Patiria miniata]XP_038059461.1 histamine N-methyltransferase-like [Patiria miniata]